MNLPPTNEELKNIINEYRANTKKERFESNIESIFEDKTVTINQIRELARDLGPGTTLEKILNEAQKQYPYLCPCCNGKGYITREYNGYPSGFPDSGSVYLPAYEDVTCDVCKGIGFTKKKIVPNMVQDGWKIEE